MKTLFSFASALNFRYLCAMRQDRMRLGKIIEQVHSFALGFHYLCTIMPRRCCSDWYFFWVCKTNRYYKVMNKILDFFRNHPIITTLLEIVAVFFILCLGVIFWLDSYTRHGEATVVPSVRYLSIDEAEGILTRKGFRCEIIDSLFNDKVAPGVIVEQLPEANARVKEGRIIYLTINAFSPRTMTMPSIVDGSVRQARAILKSAGFVNVDEQYEPSPYKDLVLNVLCNGRPVQSGEKIPVSSRITLVVGMDEMEQDSTLQAGGEMETERIILDESWLD